MIKLGTEDKQRAAVVAAARGWIGTQFHHQAAVKKNGSDLGGIDCAHLILAAHVEAKLVTPFTPENYPADWHFHRDEERFLAKLDNYARLLDEDDRPICERGVDFHVNPGNVLIWKYGRTYSHSAVVSEWPYIVHASHPAGGCIEESVIGQQTETRNVRVYSYWGS